MKVKIINSHCHHTYWYADKVGEIFEVEVHSSEDYVVINGTSNHKIFIGKVDCIVLEEAFNLAKFIEGTTARNRNEDGISDIQFEGYLCYSEQSKSYFTVDKNGNAGLIFKKSHSYPASFKIVTTAKPKPNRSFAVQYKTKNAMMWEAIITNKTEEELLKDYSKVVLLQD